MKKKNSNVERLEEKESGIRNHSSQVKSIIKRIVGYNVSIDVQNVSNNSIKVSFAKDLKSYYLINDRQERDIAVSLVTRSGSHIIMVSYSEFWAYDSKKRVHYFDKCGFRFFYIPILEGKEELSRCEQIFRVEWETCNIEDPAGKWSYPAPGAGHPHIQFDRCALYTPFRNLFDEFQQQVEEDMFLGVSEIPNIEVTWFGNIHFPMDAPWSINPYDQNFTKSDNELPHRNSPKSLESLRGWFSSVLRYMKEQIVDYAS